MLDKTFNILKEKLNGYFEEKGSPRSIDYLNVSDGDDSIKFKTGQVTPILINVERENKLRPDNQFARIKPDGTRLDVMPEIRVNLYVLFVARFSQYETSLQHLGWIIEYFQANPIFDQSNTPEITATDDTQLIVELITLPLAEQNEVWNALRTAYQPSILYKVKMITFREADPEPGPTVKEINRHMEHLDKNL